MPCDQGNYAPPIEGNGYGPHYPGAVTNPTGKTLIVSNAPETIVAGMEPTLYLCQIPLTANTPRLFRVFFWHKNETGNTLNLYVAQP